MSVNLYFLLSEVCLEFSFPSQISLIIELKPVIMAADLCE